MTDSKVSIVIPVYNGGDYLNEAIDSALAQTYKNIEILVVNDGSDDDGKTEQLALSYGAKIRYFYKPNGGVASALNMGIAEMSGDYFSWLSHDDLYTKNKVEAQIAALSEIGRNDAIIYSNYSVFTADAEKAIPVCLDGVRAENFRYWITVENRLHGCTLLIPRSAFEKIGQFNESLRTTQDYDLWYRMATAYSFNHIPAVLVKARSHPDQGTNKMAGVVLAECNDLLSCFIKGLDPIEIQSATSKPLSEAYAEIASSMFSRGFILAGKLAEEYANNYEPAGSGNVKIMKRKIRYYCDRMLNLGRRLMPAEVKQKIKAAIRSGSDKTARGTENLSEQLKEKFSEVYEGNIFGGGVSRSGEGSDLVQTAIIRTELPKIIKEFSVKTFLDAPCGDWYWMQKIDLGVEQYIGVDIVEALIEKNKKQFSSPTHTFQCLNLATDSLPYVDLIFSRDCLVHLNFDDALSIIANFKKSGARYLLTTTFVDRETNNDLVSEHCFWRALNMQLSPFDFPEPLLLINEGCTEENGQYKDKCLGLWLLEDINCVVEPVDCYASVI